MIDSIRIETGNKKIDVQHGDRSGMHGFGCVIYFHTRQHEVRFPADTVMRSLARTYLKASIHIYSTARLETNIGSSLTVYCPARISRERKAAFIAAVVERGTIQR